MLARKPTIRRTRRRSNAIRARRSSAPVVGQEYRSVHLHEDMPERLCRTPQPTETEAGKMSPYSSVLGHPNSRNNQNSPAAGDSHQVFVSEERITCDSSFSHSLQNSPTPRNHTGNHSLLSNNGYAFSLSVQSPRLLFEGALDNSCTQTSPPSIFTKVSTLSVQ